jgi:hypothetical protein
VTMYNQDETPEDIAEREASNALKLAIEAMDMAYVFEELSFKMKARETMYGCFARANECAVQAREARRKLELSRAVVGDAEVLTKKFLQTEKGKQRWKYETQLEFGKQMTRAWSNKGGLQGALAPMFTAVDGKSVSVVTALSMSIAPASSVKHAREVSYHALLDDSRDKLRNKVRVSM